MRWLKGGGLLLGTGGVGYLGMALMLFLSQEGHIFHPAAEVKATPEAVGLAYEPVVLTAEDGVRLQAWAVPHAASEHWVLFLHGNGGNRGDTIGRIAYLHARGFNVLVPDYRGYGGSEGRPSEQGTYRDAAAAWAYLVQQRGVDPERLLLYGHSLGGAIAAWLAANRAVAGLLIEGGFPDLETLARREYPYFPIGWMLRHRYPTTEHLARVRVPVLVAHSRDDEVVPYPLSEAGFRQLGDHLQWTAFSGVHDSAWSNAQGPFDEALDRFLAALWPNRSPTQAHLAGTAP